MIHPGTGKIQRYVLGELSAEARLLVDRHLARCERCRELVEQERRLDELIVGSLGGAPSAGDEDAAFARLWSAMDATGAEQAAVAPVPEAAEQRAEEPPPAPVHALSTVEIAGDARPRQAASFWLWPAAAAAAALLATAWWMAGGAGEARGPTAGQPTPVAEGLPELRGAPEVTPPTGEPDAWEPLDAARLEVARATVAEVLRSADEQFPFATEAFRLACDEGLAGLRIQGWPVAALVRGLALGSDDQNAGAALRHAALDRSNYLVLARALESEARADDALAVLEVMPLDIGDSSSLVKALERLAAVEAPEARRAAADEAPADPGAARRKAASRILAAGSGPRVRHAWDRLAQRTIGDLLRSRDARRAADRLREVAELWPPDVAVSVLEESASVANLRDGGRAAFLAHVARLESAVVQRLDESLARRQQVPASLSWCVAADLRQVVPALVRALEDGHESAQLLPALMDFGGIDVAGGLHGLWRDAHSPHRAERYLSALAQLFEDDDGLARRFGASVPLEDSESLAELAGALPPDSRRGLLAGALMAPRAGGDPGGHRAALIVALGRTGSAADGEDLVRWIAERPGHDRVLPLAWAAAGRLAPDAASLAWRDQVGDPRLLTEVVRDVSPRLAADVEPSARILAPLTAALARASARREPTPDPIPITNSPSMETLP